MPLPCIARHVELIRVVMLQGSDRFQLTGNCTGAAHLKEGQGRFAPLVPLPLPWFLSGRWGGALPSSDIGRLLVSPLVYASTFFFLQTCSLWPQCISTWARRRRATSNVTLANAEFM